MSSISKRPPDTCINGQVVYGYHPQRNVETNKPPRSSLIESKHDITILALVLQKYSRRVVSHADPAPSRRLAIVSWWIDGLSFDVAGLCGKPVVAGRMVNSAEDPQMIQWKLFFNCDEQHQLCDWWRIDAKYILGLIDRVAFQENTVNGIGNGSCPECGRQAKEFNHYGLGVTSTASVRRITLTRGVCDGWRISNITPIAFAIE